MSRHTSSGVKTPPHAITADSLPTAALTSAVIRSVLSINGAPLSPPDPTANPECSTGRVFATIKASAPALTAVSASWRALRRSSAFVHGGSFTISRDSVRRASSICSINGRKRAGS